MLHTNHLHNLLNASVDVLEKEMQWEIHNENEWIIKQPLHLHINCISSPSYIYTILVPQREMYNNNYYYRLT